jgi:alkanesulfonate monooxygenase SsuD/methylene tetrahydromethanopterin reductase-like flavin-dependent oxidoreductase (luciferase family)
MPCVVSLRLAVALERPADSAGGSLAELAQEAERGKLDFVTIAAPPELIAAEVTPLTFRIGLIAAGVCADGEFFEHITDADAVRMASMPAESAAAQADLVFVTPVDEDDVRRIVSEQRATQAEVGRANGALRIFADLVVFLDQAERVARDRADDFLEFASGTAVFAGTPAQLVRRLQSWQRAGIDGFRLRPGALPHDLEAITRSVVPLLQENDAFRRGYEAKTLRALLGLPRAVEVTG